MPVFMQDDFGVLGVAADQLLAVGERFSQLAQRQTDSRPTGVRVVGSATGLA